MHHPVSFVLLEPCNIETNRETRISERYE